MPDRIQTYRGHDNHKPNDRGRGEAKRFYARSRWRRLREIKLASTPLCEACDRRGVVTPAVHVHHVLPRATHAALAFDIGNLESLCQPCHNAQTVR